MRASRAGQDESPGGVNGFIYARVKEAFRHQGEQHARKRGTAEQQSSGWRELQRSTMFKVSSRWS